MPFRAALRRMQLLFRSGCRVRSLGPDAYVPDARSDQAVPCRFAMITNGAGIAATATQRAIQVGGHAIYQWRAWAARPGRLR